MLKDLLRDRRDWLGENRWRLAAVGFFAVGCAGAGAVLFAKFHRCRFEGRVRLD